MPDIHGSVGPTTLHENETPATSVIPTEAEGSRPFLGAHAGGCAQTKLPGHARGLRLRVADGARSLRFGRDDRTDCRLYNAHFHDRNDGLQWAW